MKCDAKKPEVELSRIGQFIRVEVAATMLNHTTSAPQYPNPNPKLANEWKIKLSPHEIGLIAFQPGEVIKRRDYGPVSIKLARFSRLKHALLMRHSRIGDCEFDYRSSVLCW